MDESIPGIARLVTAHAGGDADATADLIPLVYDRLRALAARYLASERPGHTLQPTDLVHEAYVRLARGEPIDFRSKTHFYAIAATQMRRVLVEHARAVLSQRRGRRARRVTLDEGLLRTSGVSVDIIALNQVLTKLSQRHERQGRVVELRLFSGMLVREVAQVLEVSERTVKLDWRVARAWILKELHVDQPPE